jgi:putative ABC transport system permease protein
MESVIRDLAYGLRGWRRRPAMTVAAVLALALGLGANIAVFSLVKAVVLAPLPYAAPERLVALWETNAARQLDHERLSPVNFVDYRALGAVFADAAAWWRPEVNLADAAGEPLRVATVETSSNLFSVLGVKPRLGRSFAFGGALHGSAHEAVISDRLWRGRYGGDRRVLGRAVRLDGMPYTIVGVMPPGFQFPGETDVWQGLTWDLAEHSRDAHFMEAVGRLRPGVSPRQAGRELAALTHRLAAEHPDTNQGWEAVAVPLRAEIAGTFGTALEVLMAAVGLLLLLACANVSALLLALAGGRAREVALRAALGASQGRLMRQFLTESLLLGLSGAIAGLALGWSGLRAFAAARPAGVPATPTGLDAGAFAFAAAVALGAVVGFGLLPALRMSRARLRQALQDAGRGSAAAPGRRRRRGRAVLIAGELALAQLLLVGAALLAHGFVHLARQQPGFRPEQAVAINVELPYGLYDDFHKVSRFFGELVDRVAATPGVRAAGAASFLPLASGWRNPYGLPGRVTPESDQAPSAQVVTVTPGYFAAVGVPLLAGRAFDARDREGSRPVVMVNRAFARQAWPGESGVGKIVLSHAHRIGPLAYMLAKGSEFEVVGVVADAKNHGLAGEVEPALYFVSAQFPYRNLDVVARGQLAAGQLAAAIRAQVRRLDPSLATAEARPLAELVAASTAQARLLMWLMNGFAVLALLLAMVGVYGVVAYGVSQRRGEMGVRLALGATPSRLRRLVVAEGMRVAALGIALGAAGALALSRLLASLLYGVSTRDGVAFAVAPLLLAAVVFVACDLPARRAARLDPRQVLAGDE